MTVNLESIKPSNYKPCGYYILVEVEPMAETHEGTAIIMVQDERQREHGGRDIGRIKEIGPIAFKGFDNCKGPEDWGVKKGDLVEFNRYDGKIPRVAEINEDFKNYRVVLDNDIIAVMGV